MGLAEAIFDHLHRRGAFMIMQAVKLEGRLEEDAMRAALAALQRRHPLLRCHVAQPGAFEPGAEPIELELLPRRDADHWQEVTEHQVHRPLPLGPLPQVRVTWLRDTDGARSELVIASNHALLDGASAATLLRELLAHAGALTLGDAPPALPPQPPQPPIEQVLRPPPVQWPSWQPPACLRPEAAASPGARRSRLRYGELDADTTGALAVRARERGTSVHGAICAAMLLAIRQTESARRLTLSTNVSLRPETSPRIGDEHMGSYVSALITNHQIGAATAFWPLACEVKAELARRHAAGEHILRWRGRLGRLGRSALALAPHIANGRWQALNVTNPGKLDLPTTYGSVKLLAYYGFAGQALVGADVQLCVMTLAGTLGYSLQYVEPLMSSATAARVELRFRDALTRAARGDADLTAGELAA
jgi:hypothetical protein